MRGVGYAYAEGGDEIKFFLPNATETIAREVAEALRRTVETLKFEGAAAAHAGLPTKAPDLRAQARSLIYAALVEPKR